MEATLLSHIAIGCANTLLVLALAPLGEGLLRRVTAILQSRRGPPLHQSYLDLLKLLGKEDLESGECPVLQRIASRLSFAAVLAVCWFVPMGGPAPLGGSSDVVMLIYLLTLCGIGTMLAGLTAGSPFSLLGVNREMMCMLTLEPLLAIALLIGATHSGSLGLDSVLSGSAFANSQAPWSGVLMLVLMVLALPAFAQRVPFDVAEAETEIMSGSLAEYSGPKLALFKYSQMIRLVVYCGLFVALFVPWGGDLVFPLGWLIFWAKLAAMLLFVTIVAATHVRYRVDQTVRYFAGFLVLGAGALALAVYGF